MTLPMDCQEKLDLLASNVLFLNRGYAKRKHELLGTPMSLNYDLSVST